MISKLKQLTENAAVRKWLLFGALFFALLLLIIPLYRISYKSIATKVYSDVAYRTEEAANSVDSELIMLHEIKTDLRSNPQYSMIKSIDKFSSSSQYMILKNFSKEFMGRTGMLRASDDIYIFFKNNNIAVSKEMIFDDISGVFESYLSIDGMNYEEFRNTVFKVGTGIRAEYFENTVLQGEKSPSVVIFYPVDPHIGQSPEAVIAAIYKIDSLFGRMSGEDYKELLGYISVNDKIVYAPEKLPAKDEIIMEVCSNAELHISTAVSEKYLKKYMAGFRRVVYLYITILLLFVFGLQILLDRYSKRPIRSMVRLVANIMGNSEIRTADDMYAAICSMSEDKKSYEKSLLTTLFFKPADNEEAEFIRSKYPDFPEPFIMAVIRGENLNEKILRLLMGKFGLDTKMILPSGEDEFTAVFSCSDELDTKILRERLDDMRFSAKNNGVNLTILIGIPCRSITEFYPMYTRLQSRYRAIDYRGVFALNEESDGTAGAIAEDNNNDKLRSTLLCAQTAEAKKLVYEQWYGIMAGNEVDDISVEQLFYSQMGVISEVAMKCKYKGPLVRYSKTMKINELAFAIADDIDALCEFIETRSKRDDEYDRILEFIDENCCRLNFGIPDAENEFKITGKTVNKMVKAKTGQTFTEYVEAHRLARAKELLQCSADEVKYIAESCGFQNYDTFYKFFKKHTGVSPVKWRKMKLTEENFG